MLTTNQTLHNGRYKIINSSIQDDAGGLYEAYDTVSNTNVVLKESIGRVNKVLTPQQRESMNAAFLGEAKNLADVNHDSIISVQDYFSEINRHYLVLEPVSGTDLSDYLTPDAERPTLSQVLIWSEQLLDALNYLHQLEPPIFHRNIRPENIKIVSDHGVKLLTSVVSHDSNLAPDSTVDSSKGDSHQHYRPLEQIWNDLDPASQRVILNSYDERSENYLKKPFGARSDMYSLGATIYHLITGVLPNDALDRTIAILDGLPDPLRPIQELDPSIPSEISDAIMRSLELRREKRFDSVVFLRQVLRTALVRIQERDGSISDAPLVNDGLNERLEAERKLAEQRAIELEAEERRLAEEREQLEMRQRELESEKQRQLADAKRLQQEAEQAKQLAEQESIRLERERLEREADEERKRVAIALSEIEAEEKRLSQQAENERKLAEERIARLEAESAQKRAEQERLDREAAEERARAEQRLQELESKAEQRRSEQLRIEADAREHLELRQQRLQELSGSSQSVKLDNTDESATEPEGDTETVPEKEESFDDLLELGLEQFDPVPLSAAAPSAEVNEPLHFDEVFEQPATENSLFSSLNVSENEVSEDNVAGKWKVPAIAVGVLVLLAIVFGAWSFLSSDPTVKSNPAAAVLIPMPEDSPVAVQTEPETLSVPETLPEPDVAQSEVPTVKDLSKPTKAELAAEKPKKQAAVAEAKTANAKPAKKAVTVDDLINDN